MTAATDNATTLQQRADKVIAGGALTNSKRPQSFVRGVYPTHLTKALDCTVWDESGRRLVDYVCALGTNLFGYNNREINHAIAAQLNRGTLYSLGSPLEVELAERITTVMPHFERVRFLKTGTEACMAAVKIARAATGRSLVLSDGYHGWADGFVSLTPPALGVPVENRLSYQTLTKFTAERYMKQAAAVIVEPVITDYSEARLEYLKELRELTKKYKTPLIFDETITAFRFPGLSFAQWSGIYPDISVFGKALGAGLPIAVVAGSKELMDADYFVSGTFAGEMLSMAAAMKVIDLAKGSQVIDHMWLEAAQFQKEFNAISPLIRIDGYPLRGVFVGDDLPKALFFQEACKAGVLFGSSFFWCEPHRDERQRVISICKTILNRIALDEVRLEGEMPKKPFAQTVREHEVSGLEDEAE